jgi:hypothetical protein
MSAKLEERARELGRKAKELVEGMNKRVNRLPDVADYAAAFMPLLTSVQAEARRTAIHDVEMVFKKAYSEQDDPLIGVMYGMKAIAALAQAVPPGTKEE